LTYLLVAFLVVALIPLFAASWRTSLLGLSLQGLLLGWIALRTFSVPSPAAALTLVDLVLIRGFLAPRTLYRVLSDHHRPRRHDLIPSNLFSWMLVGTVVLASFHFATGIAKADDVAGVLHLATATAALLLGFLVLATQNSMFSQMVGLLRIENAIALYELMSPQHWGFPIQLGIAAVFLLTVLVFGRFLGAELGGITEPPPVEQRPSL
jgi:hydrogenase-4 component E